jgi:hypothetical protein
MTDLTEQQRNNVLFDVLYDSLRWPGIVASGGFHEFDKRRWRRRSNELIDNTLTVIAWALAQPAFDFHAFDSIFPKDRAVLVKYLKIAQRELREISKLPEPSS